MICKKREREREREKKNERKRGELKEREGRTAIYFAHLSRERKRGPTVDLLSKFS